MSVAVFGYGSLINAESLARTIGRTPGRDEFFPAWLEGYCRIWNYRAESFSLLLNRKIQGVFLNVMEADGEGINGVIFRVSEAELEQLKKRERNYSFIDVTEKAKGIAGERVFTFACDDPEFTADPGKASDPDFFVLKRYRDLVHAGCQAWGSPFLDDFHRTTRPIPFAQLEGEYRFP